MVEQNSAPLFVRKFLQYFAQHLPLTPPPRRISAIQRRLAENPWEASIQVEIPSDPGDSVLEKGKFKLPTGRVTLKLADAVNKTELWVFGAVSSSAIIPLSLDYVINTRNTRLLRIRLTRYVCTRTRRDTITSK